MVAIATLGSLIYCSNAYCHVVTMSIVLYLLYARVLVTNINLGAQSVNVIVQLLYRYRTERTACMPCMFEWMHGISVGTELYCVCVCILNKQ